MPNKITVQTSPFGKCPVCGHTPRLLDIIFETDYVGGHNVTVIAVCDNGHVLEHYEDSEYELTVNLKDAKWVHTRTQGIDPL